MLIIDGSHTLHRCLFTFYDLINSNGVRTGLIHGFFLILGNLARAYKKEHGIVVCWDDGASRYRKSIYPIYKDGRDPDAYYEKEDMTSEELERDQVYLWSRRLLHDGLLPLADCISLQVSNVEADDIAAWLVQNIQCDEKKILVTSDNDWMQLIGDNVDYYNPISHKSYTKESFIQEYNLIPEAYKEQFLMMKSMIGDGLEAPGIKGIGDAWANKISKIILEEGIDTLRPSQVAKHKLFVEGSSEYELSRRLVDLDMLPDQDKKRIKDELKLMTTLTTDYSSETTLHEKLFKMEMKKAREQVSDIVDCNIRSGIRETLKRQIF